MRQALLRSLERAQRGGPSQTVRLRRSFRRHRFWLIPTMMAVLVGVAVLLAVRPFAKEPFPAKAGPDVGLSAGDVRDTVWFETSEYSATFDDVRRRLEQLEGTGHSAYLHVPGSDWDSEMQSIHAVLERLSDNPGSDPGAFE